MLRDRYKVRNLLIWGAKTHNIFTNYIHDYIFKIMLLDYCSLLQ